MHDLAAYVWTSLCAFVNPPERVVAWGGRPGIDVQVGSRHDRRRARHLDEVARLRLLSAASIARMTAAMKDLGVVFGVAAASAARSMERFAQAMRNSQAELDR